MIFAKTKAPNKHRAGKTPIFFFDSECALCDKFVMYIFNNTKKGELRFCSIHGIFADYLIRKHLGRRPDFRTSYILLNGFLYEKTDAILRALKLTKNNTIKGKILSTIVQIIYYFNEFVLFNKLFDRAYDIVSKYREKLLTNNICELPNAKYREEGNERFIE